MKSTQQPDLTDPIPSDPDIDSEADEDSEDDFLDVTCPGCNARLTDESTFETWRVCHSCGRHFWLPARERLSLIVDPDSFREINGEIVSIDPLIFQDIRGKRGERVDDDERPQNSMSNALVTGIAKIGGCQAVVVVADFAMLGDAIGIAAGEKIVLAIETAASKRLPLVAITSDGPAGAGNESVSAMQSLRITNALARLQRNGMPFIAILSHPSTGALFQGFSSHADILLAEPGTQVGYSTVTTTGESPAAASASAAEVLEAGAIDGVVVRNSLKPRLTTFLDVFTRRAAPRSSAESVASTLSQRTAADEQSLARHSNRPGPSELVDLIMSGFIELRGDRISGDERSVRIGFGQVDGVSVALILYGSSAGDAKNGEGTSVTASGLRKAERLYRLAALVELPVVALVANGVLTSNHPSEGATIAQVVSRLAHASASITVPTITVIVGEIGGLPPLSLATADRVLMQEHAVLVQTRESTPLPISGSAATPKKQQVMTARDLQRIRLVHTVIPEPSGGAHTDPRAAAQEIRLAITHELAELSGIGPRHRRDDRSRHLRDVGLSGSISEDHLKLELAQLQEIQKAVGLSILDIRDRVESYNRQIPVLLQLPERPGMPTLSRQALPDLPSMRRPGVSRPELADIRTRLNSRRKDLSEKIASVKDATSSIPDESGNQNSPESDSSGDSGNLVS